MKAANISIASVSRAHESNLVANEDDVPRHRHDQAHDHSVQFYDEDAFLATVVSEFLAGGLKAGQPVIVIATASHRKAFIRRLGELDIDVLRACDSGQLTLLDARRTLKQFMRDARPNARRFREVVGGAIERSLAGREGLPVCAYGEMVDLLFLDTNADGAVELEQLWNDLAKRHDFSLLCAYKMDHFNRAAHTSHFEAICSQHTHVAPTERYTQRDSAARLVEISSLQQRARALEDEVERGRVLERQLKETVAALQHREAELRDVVENAAEGIHLVGADGIIQWANNAELGLLGYDAEEYIGHHVTEFHADRSTIEDLLSRLLRGEEVQSYNARLLHKDGSIRHVLINSNVRFEDGRFRNTRCFTRDITALHVAHVEREAALERARIARDVAEQANRGKSEFLAVMSHELRTPLNAIGGYAELIELGVHGPVTAPQAEALERIQRSQRLLLGLVNQVLNYARVESGNIRYRIEEIPLDAALRSVEGSIAPQMRAKAIQYSYAGCEPRIGVRADEDKLQQILLNLLTNAVKFTERGGSIRLAVECTARVAMIHLTDTGIGIPGDKLDVIFDPFVQVDANYTRTRDGVGLGLAISRDLARGMGGDLVLRSTQVGVGSTFTLTLQRLQEPTPA